MVAVVVISLSLLLCLCAVLYLRRLGNQVRRHGVRPVARSGSDGVPAGSHSWDDGADGDGGGGGGGGGGD